MKNIIVVLASLIVLVSTSSEKHLPNRMLGLTDENDKNFLLNNFQETSKELRENIRGLSAAQMQFKSSEDNWSVSECIEHIILTEKMLFNMSRELMEKPANPQRRAEVKFSDEDLMAGPRDRSRKATATKELEGQNTYTEPEKAMGDLETQRQEILAYIKSKSLDDLRNHVTDSPFGPVDAYQWFLFMAGHTARHTLQIAEIKQGSSFPKE